MSKSNKGFTLIELLVVISMLGILVLLTVPKYLGYTDKANVSKHLANLKSIENASEVYYLNRPVIKDDKYGSEQIENFAEYIYDKSGAGIELDKDGNYYDIDYEKLSNYIKVEEEDKPYYLIQNPKGKVVYLHNLNDAGKHRNDEDFIKNNKPIAKISASNLYAGKEIIYSHDESQTPKETKIVNSEWKNNKKMFNKEGLYKVELRVQNDLGLWSDWTSKEIDISYKTLETYNFKNKGVNVNEWTVPESGVYRIVAKGARRIHKQRYRWWKYVWRRRSKRCKRNRSI